MKSFINIIVRHIIVFFLNKYQLRDELRDMGWGVNALDKMGCGWDMGQQLLKSLNIIPNKETHNINGKAVTSLLHLNITEFFCNLTYIGTNLLKYYMN